MVSRAVSIRMATSEPSARIRRATSIPEMSGQTEVEHDDLDAAGRLDDVESIPAGRGGLDDVAILLQQAPEEADQPGVVLDDEEVHRLSLRLPYGTTVMLEAVPSDAGSSPLAVGGPLPVATSSNSEQRDDCRHLELHLACLALPVTSMAGRRRTRRRLDVGSSPGV